MNSRPALIRLSHCLRHADRPAVARCRACGEAFCRECVIEHEHRLICAECLRREADARMPRVRGGWWRRLPWAALFQWMAGGAVLWMVFYGVGEILQRIPAEVHKGVIWLDD